jgi:hypothetical protein
MTLSEICGLICAKIGQSDDATVSACRAFVNARWQQLWDAAPWRESLAIASARAGANDAGVAIIPLGLERVLGVRCAASGIGQTALAPLELNSLLQYDAGLWDQAGPVTNFVTLEPTAIAAVRNDANLGAVVYSFFSSDVTEVTPDVGVTIYLSGLADAGGSRFEETITTTLATDLPGMYYARAVSKFGYLNITAITKPATRNGFIAAYGNSAAGQTDPAPPVVRPDETAFPRFQRIKVLGAPPADLDLLVLGKRRFAPMVDPNSQAALRNCDNVLIALATGDMLERQRQYAKAQAKFQEGQQQLQILLDLERNQAATDLRIIPAQIHEEFRKCGGI